MTGLPVALSEARDGFATLDPSHRPLVSIVLPCFREPIPILQRTLDSVLSQTYPNIEIVVVVDDPGNAAILTHLKRQAEADNCVRVVVNQHNLGAWGSYNRGVAEAKGELIAIQDADDVSAPNRIEALVGFLLQNPTVGVVGSGLEYVDATSGRTLMMRNYPSDPGRAIRRYCPLAHGTTLRWAHLFKTHGGYDESRVYRHAADYELWCRWFARRVRMANVPDALYTYYQSDSNFKSQNVKAILRDTVRIKARYSRALRFGIGDYLWLAAETLASLLPARAVVAAFYALNRRRSAHMTRQGEADIDSTKGSAYTQLLK
jgi:glycosyltransferase EpsE